MDFNLSDDIKAVSETVRRYANEQLKPKYQHWDKSGEFPREMWQEMGNMGFFGSVCSSEYGGTEMGALAHGVITYEVARGDFNAAYPVLLCGGLPLLLEKLANDDIKNEWIPKVLTAEKLVGFCLTEPGSGSDAAGLLTRAEEDGDEWVITGEKASISLVMEADALLVFAKTKQDDGSTGVSLFFVPTDSEGFSCTPYDDMGHKAVKRGSASFQGVRIPKANLLGTQGKGFPEAMKLFDIARVLLTLMCVGAAEISIEETGNYIKERKAFGKPIGKFQGVQFPLVEAHSHVEMVKLYCYRTLWLRDQGLPHTKEASICKAMGQRFCIDAIYTCMQLHGHYGYTSDFPFEQRLRDTIGIEFADGTSQVQKMVIARELLGREVLAYD